MLVGRDRELDLVAAGLERSRLVTLVGPGGVGKTSLARAAMQMDQTTALFTELTAFDDAEVVEGIAGSLGFGSLDHLMDDLGTGPHLLVVDNCEHVLDSAAALIERLLASITELRVLATSRERLDVPGEQVIVVEPFSTEGSPSPATQVYLELAHARGMSPADDPAVIDELCRRLDGLPLALELAAARATSMTAGEMIDNLEVRLDLLSRARQRGPERHQSLEAAIAWSYHQLDIRSREVFEAVSVFPAPFSVDLAAAAVDMDAPGMAEVLHGLVERSMLTHDPAAGTSWYRTLDTIRMFARARLQESDSSADVADRLMRHMAERADQLFADGKASLFSVPQSLSRLYRHLHWAADRAIEVGDCDAAIRLASPLWWLEDVGHQAEAADLIRRILDRWGDEIEEATLLLGTLGALDRMRGGKARGHQASAEAAAGSGLGAAYGHRTLGQNARLEGRWDEALAHFAAATDAADEAGHHGLAMEMGMHAALTRARAGDIEQAIEDLEAIVAAGRDFPLAHAWAADFLAYLLLDRDPERARVVARDLLPIGRDANERWLVASAHNTLAAVALMERDLPSAIDPLCAAIEDFVSIRNRNDITISFLLAAGAFVQAGDETTARRVRATERQYIGAVLGGFESRLLDRIGPVPDPEPADAPLEALEIVRRLRDVETGEPTTPTGSTADGNRLVRTGDIWLVGFGGEETRLRHSKGMGDLAQLLARPHREIAALDLMEAAVVGSTPDEVSDAAARRSYRAKVRALQSDLDTAEAAGDHDAAERARQEMDAILAHLGAAYGLGGRSRVAAAPAEKARSAVTWRIRAAIKRIDEALPPLGDHLHRAVRTGRFCVYDPPQEISWEVDAGSRR